MLPWYDHDGVLQHSAMTLKSETPITKRKGFSIMRKWYKEHIGQDLSRAILEVIWKDRFETIAKGSEEIDEYMHKLARETYDESLKDNPDIAAQEAANEKTGE